MTHSEQTHMMMVGLLTTEPQERQDKINGMVAKIKELVDGSPEALYALSLVTLEHEIEDAKRIKRNAQLANRKKTLGIDLPAEVADVRIKLPEGGKL